MRNFGRAVRRSLRFRGSLLALLVSSIAVAVLWGGNLGAVYPLVDIVLQRQSLVQWVDQSIEESRTTCGRLDQNLCELRRRIAATDEAARGPLRREFTACQARLAAETRMAGTALWLQPWIHRYCPEKAFPTLVLVMAAVLLATAIKVAFLVMSTVLVERVAQLVTFDLRKALYRRTLQLNLVHTGHDRTATLISHFTHDLEGLTCGLRTVFGRAVREPLKIVACLLGAAWISWRLLLLSLIVTPLAVFLINRLASSVKRANRRAMVEMANLYHRLSESLNGLSVVKAFTKEPFERRRFHQQSKEYFQRTMRIALYTSLSRPSVELMSMGVVCMAILAGGYLVLNQETHILGIKLCSRPLSVPSLTTFFALLVGVSDPFRKLADVYNQIQRGAAAADRIYALLDREPEVGNPSRPRPLPHPLREIVLEGVSFRYDAGQAVLSEIDLCIKAGETVAIVGPNGSGKSSLIGLIPRFYDPTAGSVRWNDCSVRDVRLRDLRQQIGLVTQHSLLFDDTVANNIRYGARSATDQEVVSAARQARAHEFISTVLREGYDTVVGTGGERLSGGQRQRIALARAILRNPEILILDEATSHVDSESERQIQQALEELSRDRTTIVITHRLQTLTIADRIVVMDSGRIADVGTHHQLLGRCGIYQRLYRAEFRAA